MRTCRVDLPRSSWTDSDWEEFSGSFAEPPWERRIGTDVLVFCRCGQVRGRRWRYTGTLAELIRAITADAGRAAAHDRQEQAPPRRPRTPRWPPPLARRRLTAGRDGWHGGAGGRGAMAGPDYDWRLRELMVLRGMFKTTDLIEPLADRGITRDRAQVYRLVARKPRRMDISMMLALCDILGCQLTALAVPCPQEGPR